ncbi:lysine decarboxylase [Caloramator fervidus]|uniref:Lysine decarboxylase n=1 Tax=Caloramator fervidus TaxID=29344 RepID=A0A1H5XQC3_9CLOT|nr:aminotransferase class V-fold PLP-dependent enzyme [Caloramator fervidus]SEG13894.1 lysine decarboxylase [Caloramator fervidus]
MNTPLINGILDYIKQKNIPFHMPGHKNNAKDFEELKVIQKYLFDMDLTEVDGLDNLHSPEGIIKETQEKISKCLGSEESFILVNGSTAGIYSMILGVTKPKDKIIIQRNSHRSVYSAAFLGDLEVEYINPKVLDGFNIPVSIDLDEAFKVIEKNKDAKAVVLTYPTYYGTCFDLESLINHAHKHGILVLVDEAHGAHFPFNNKLPKSAISLGADVSVNSFHKTLPSLTQTAVLNVNKGVDVEGIKYMLRMFQSTSPSYVLMASVDAAINIMEREGEKLLDEVIYYIDEFKKDIKGFDSYNILDENFIGKSFIYDLDKTRIVINTSFGGKVLDSILRKNYNIQVEMSDIFNIVLIGSVGDKKEFYDRLKFALLDLKDKMPKTVFDYKNYSVSYKKVLSLREAYYLPKKKVKLREAKGLVSAEMVVPYPPGIPILIPGEIITDEIIELLDIYRANNITLNGLSDSNAEYIFVVNGG